MEGIDDDVGVFGIEACRYEIKGILLGVIASFFEVKLGFEEEFLVVSELEVVGTLELVLHPFSEDELREMSNVGVTTGSPSIVEVEGIAFLVFIEDEVHVPVTEVNPTGKEIVKLSCIFLDSG